MAQVRVFTGLNRSSHRRERMNEILLDAPNATRLIVPTQRAVQQRVRNIIETRGHPGFLGRPVITFQEFAEQILADWGEVRRPMPGLTQHVLLKSAIARCAGHEDLAFLGDAIHTPGFLNHVQRVIAMLKQSALDPEAFHALVVQRQHQSPFDAVVVQVYRVYQELLLESKASDLQGLYWLADQACREGVPEALRSTTRLLIDGFDDFTPSEFRLIASTAPHLDEIVFGMNVSTFPEREDAYALPLATTKKIRKRFPEAQVSDFSESGRAPTRATDCVSEYLFARDPKPVSVSDIERNLSLVACDSVRAEVETLARLVKREIVEQGTAPGDIVIAMKSPEGISGLIDDVFHEAGIPVRQSQRESLASSPFAGYIVSIMSLVWKAEEVADVLRSPFFRIVMDCDTSVSDTLPSVALRAQLGTGEASLQQGLQRFLERLDTDGGRTVRDWQAHTPLLREGTIVFQQGLERLRRLASLVPEQGLLSEYVSALESLLDAHAAHRVETVVDESDVIDAIRDREGLEAVCAMMGSMSAITDTTMPRAEFGRLLTECLTFAPLERDHAPGGVLCLSLDEVRHIECPKLFVCGANEGTLPSLPPRNAIYSAEDQRDLSKAGVEFESASEHAARERLLFLRIFEAADQVVVLWHEHNAEGQATYKSPYILEVERLEELGVVSLERPDLPPWSLTERDAVAGIVEGAVAPSPDIGDRVAQVAERATTEKMRWSGHGFNAYDGVLDDPELIEQLAAFYDARHVFSASQLETWLDCPFRFLMSEVLQLRSDEMDAELLDPRRVGSILHDALEAYYAEKPANTVDDAAARMGEIAHEVCDDALQSYSATHPGAAQAERVRLVNLLQRHVRLYHDEVTQAWTPTLFEVDFGQPGSEKAFALPVDDTKYMVTGRIDRVDVNDAGKIRVVDYKTSVASDVKGKIKAGNLVQLVLYWMAVEQLGLVPDAEMDEGHYQHIGRNNRTGIKAKEFDEIRGAALSRIAESITSIQSGAFPLAAGNKPCSYCPAGKACRFEAARVTAKAAE